MKGPGLKRVEGRVEPAPWAGELMAEAIDEAVGLVVAFAEEGRAEPERGYCGTLGPDILEAVKRERRRLPRSAE